MRCPIKKQGFIDPVTCIVCPARKCKHYETYYLKNREKMLEMAMKYSQQYPERYKLEVYMAQTKSQKAKHYIVLDKDQKVVDIIEEERVKNLSGQDVNRYGDKKILGPVTHEYAMIVKLQKKEWSGNLDITTPEPKAKTTRKRSSK